MHNSFTLLLACRSAILLQHFGDSLEKAWIMSYEGESMHETLGKALLSRPHASLSIFLDTESFEIKSDVLPPASPWQVEKVLSRQRGFHFPVATLSASVLAKDGKDNYSLHAASEVDSNIQKTLAGLYHIINNVEPLGFYGLEAMRILTALPDVPAPPSRLVLLLGEATGLRQMVVKGGVPLLTRAHVECVPSQEKAALVAGLLQHVQSTRDYLPRLDATLKADIPVQLFVPAELKALAAEPEIQRAGIEVFAMEAPRSDLVPSPFALDIAVLARLALQKKRLLPFAPDWLKGRHERIIMRQDVSIMMFVFGCAGIAFGLQTLLGTKLFSPKSPPAIEHVEERGPIQVAPEAKKTPPAMKLDALVINGPSDWAVWINGQKYTPEIQEGPIKVLDVGQEGVHVLWQEGDNRKEMFLKPDGGTTGKVTE
jgi:hypothetical protein